MTGLITADRTFDAEIITRTMRHPKLYEHLSDDGCPPASHFDAPVHDGLIYLAMHEDEEFLGVFLFHPQNHVCYEVHTCLLPSAWGKRALLCTAEAAKWIFGNTACTRIVTSVPAYNKLALRLAERSGMVQYGLNPKSFLKNGILHDQALLGMNKEALCQQQP